ncbi:putative C6 finger domain protein [Aspergillus lucknowensis]|uniref:Zn(2)-C6 fungal-type domain-containing protein n=1 Tax=Aspergillus lucknowensis TaxID=176173 RepID=A0ABR4M4Q3_9EURO
MSAAVECMTSVTISQTAVMEPSTADKKRNKLGYHRTSVACVHCRRRKIRCLVAADDAQGRCENCIRLRKECQFFPVDQQPPIEKKSRPGSRIETISADASTASSSPPTVTGEQQDAFYPYQSIPLSTGQEVPAFSAGAYSGNPMAQFGPDATAPMDPSVPWDEFTTITSDQQMLANMSAAAKQTMASIPPNVWSQPATPIAAMPGNPSLPGAPTLPSQQPLSPTSPYAVQADGSVWQMTPTRSMTFPAQPNMASQYPSPSGFAQPMPTDLKRRMTTPSRGYPPSSMNPQSPPTTDLQGPPVSVSYAAQPAATGYPAWQDMNGMQPVNMVPYPVYAGDATQQAAFGSHPMGHPGPGHPQGP